MTLDEILKCPLIKRHASSSRPSLSNHRDSPSSRNDENHHLMACLGLLYIHASASTSLTSPRSATSASRRDCASVSRRFSSLSTVSSATIQACSVRGASNEEANARPGRSVSALFGRASAARPRARGRKFGWSVRADRRRVRFTERSVASDLNEGDETHRRVVVVDDVPPLAGGFRRRPSRGADPAGASEQSRHGCRRGRHRVERNDERVFSSSVVLRSRVTRRGQ